MSPSNSQWLDVKGKFLTPFCNASQICWHRKFVEHGSNGVAVFHPLNVGVLLQTQQPSVSLCKVLTEWQPITAAQRSAPAPPCLAQPPRFNCNCLFAIRPLPAGQTWRRRPAYQTGDWWQAEISHLHARQCVLHAWNAATWAECKGWSTILKR